MALSLVFFVHRGTSGSMQRRRCRVRNHEDGHPTTSVCRSNDRVNVKVRNGEEDPSLSSILSSPVPLSMHLIAVICRTLRVVHKTTVVHQLHSSIRESTQSKSSNVFALIRQSYNDQTRIYQVSDLSDLNSGETTNWYLNTNQSLITWRTWNLFNSEIQSTVRCNCPK